MKKDDKKVVIDFIKKNKIGTSSTISPDGKPEATSMAISQKDNLELIFQTPNNTRKYYNLKRNPRVAIVFGFDVDEFITIQYEGIAREAEAQEIDECRKIHINKGEKSQEYAYLPQNKYFIVKPRWIRYWDFDKNKTFILSGAELHV